MGAAMGPYAGSAELRPSLSLSFNLRASLLGGFATGQAWLLAARAAQGIGAAFAAPTALSLIAVTFPEGPPRNRAMAHTRRRAWPAPRSASSPVSARPGGGRVRPPAGIARLRRPRAWRGPGR